MATFEQIKEVRLRINDPEGYQDFLEVADAASLPADPATYTAYKVLSSGAYVATDLESGATAADYQTLPLRVSDARLSSWIDLYGVDIAECKALQAIVSRIGSELNIKRLDGGAETTEYQSLKDLYGYYRDMWNDCKDRVKENTGNSTGRYGTSSQPQIAGGNI